MTGSKIDDHLIMVELVGPRLGRPAHDAATTLPFQREELDTEKVLRVAPIDDPVDSEAQPYPPIHVGEPAVPIALDARINLVAVDRTPTRVPTDASSSRGREVAIAAGFLAGALAAGISLAFLIAAIAR